MQKYVNLNFVISLSQNLVRSIPVH